MEHPKNATFYKRKTPKVEAFQYDGDLKGSNGEYYVPEWAVRAFGEGTIFYDSLEEGSKSRPGELFIYMPETSESYHVAVGDYIVNDECGAICPCERRMFEKFYEQVTR